MRVNLLCTLLAFGLAGIGTASQATLAAPTLFVDISAPLTVTSGVVATRSSFLTNAGLAVAGAENFDALVLDAPAGGSTPMGYSAYSSLDGTGTGVPLSTAIGNITGTGAAIPFSGDTSFVEPLVRINDNTYGRTHQSSGVAVGRFDTTGGVGTGAPTDASSDATNANRRYLEFSGSLVIEFTSAVSAFGMYLTDINDYTESIEFCLAPSKGGASICSTLSGGGTTGSIAFVGFSDDTDTYKSVTITQHAKKDQTNQDVVGIDDFFTAAKSTQPAPEPTSIALVGAGLLAIGRRRKKLNM